MCFPIYIKDKMKLKYRHKLLCGDSTSIEDVELLMNDEKADMAFTSPPYNGNTHIAEGSYGDTSMKRVNLYKNNETDNKNIDEYIEFNNKVFKNIYFATKDNSDIFYNLSYNKKSKSAYITIINNALNDFSLRETIIWKKQMAMSLEGDNLTRIYEFIFMLSKGNGLPMVKEQHECIKNLWEISNINSQKSEHKACFPVELPEKAINMMKSELVFEPFCGSGSTLIACEKNGRRCFGIEIDPTYCQLIIERWQQYTGKLAYIINENSKIAYNEL